MTESFPRQQARTQRFTLGAPRSFQISRDGNRVAFLRSQSGTDPVTCLWVLDVGTGQERLVADPATLDAIEGDLPAWEKARRERTREQAGGIVAFATDTDMTMAAFALAGQVYVADLANRASVGHASTGHTSTGHTSTGPASTSPASTSPASTGPASPGPRQVGALSPALDPRPDPTGQRVAYVCQGALRVVEPDTGQDTIVAGAGAESGITFGLAEFIAAEEMGRMRGYWWAPDGSALLVARVDEAPVNRWYLADPANPQRPATELAYPAAGTPNADVSLLLVRLDGGQDTTAQGTAGQGTGGQGSGQDTTDQGSGQGTASQDAAGQGTTVQGTTGQDTAQDITGQVSVDWDRAAFPYLVTAHWQEPGPLIVVQSRDQRRMRILSVDPVSGDTTVLREDSDERWLDIVPGVPARTDAGRIVWTTDDGGARRLLVATPDELRDSSAAAVTPPALQVRQIVAVDGDFILFTASQEPMDIGLWLFGPPGLAQVSPREGIFGGQRAGGTTLITTQTLAEDGVTAVVLRDDPDSGTATEVARIRSLAERPNLPNPQPLLGHAGRRAIRAALLLPSWHEPGSRKLPVLLDPYGGPHAQRVLAARAAFLTSQWLAEQGFAVLVADGRGTPGPGAGVGAGGLA